MKVEEFESRVIRSEKISNVPIVFLHGYVFTSEVWREIGVLKMLEERGIPFIAVDMPYGLKSKCNPKTKDPDANVRLIERVIGKYEPVIVGASLGGYIALKYSLRNPVKGLLLIAPVRCFERELLEGYRKFNARVCIIYGKNDRIVSLRDMEELSKILNARLIVYENADHPAYLSEPERFRKDLLEFYTSLK